MGSESKWLIIVGFVVAVAVGLLVVLTGNQTAKPKEGGSNLVRDDSHQTLKGAKVTVVEFGDYQCPACGAAQPVVEQLRAEHQKDVNFVFRNFPLSQHKNAKAGSEAAEAAGEQGKYWEMNSQLYATQSQWESLPDPTTFFVTLAQTLQLDTAKFKDAVISQKFASIIQRDIDDGTAVGVNSTPTFFVNSQQIDGIASLKSKIESELKK